QAEDGIRDATVTGVQTCALPISISSPLAVRGQSMQDVIFAGGAGVQSRSEAEVEVVLDNSGEGAVDLPAGEISIVRRLTRAGEGDRKSVVEGKEGDVGGGRSSKK